MKPFDLEKALAGEPVVTQDGRKVSQITLFKLENGKERLICVAEGIHPLLGFSIKDGKINQTDHDGIDIFMAPKTEKWWVAIKKDPNVYINSTGEQSRDCSYAMNSKEKLFELMDRFKMNQDEWVIKEIEIEV